MSTTLSSSPMPSASPLGEYRSHYGMTDSGSRTEIVRPTVNHYEGLRASGSIRLLLSASIAASLYANSATAVAWDPPAVAPIHRGLAGTHANEPTETLVAAAPESTQVAYLLENLISNRSALADILGISRTALYDWLAGKPVSPDNSAHLNRITVCVQRAAAGRTTKLYHRYLSERILAKTPALSELLKQLKDEHADQSSVLTLLAKAWDMSEAREAKDRAIAQRLASKGLPELTAEQRRANSERNRLMQDLRRGERG